VGALDTCISGLIVEAQTCEEDFPQFLAKGRMATHDATRIVRRQFLIQLIQRGDEASNVLRWLNGLVNRNEVSAPLNDFETAHWEPSPIRRWKSHSGSTRGKGKR